MRKKAVLIWATTFFLGSLWHFFYDYLPILPVALVAPINESVWEHLKLLYFPVIVVQWILLGREKDNRRLGGICFALLLMPFLLLGSFYILNAGFLVESLWVDIALYAITLAVGEWAIAHTAEGLYPHRGILLSLAALFGVVLILLTLAVPDYPVFVARM